MKYRVKNLRWCPPAERAGRTRVAGFRDGGRAMAVIHDSGSQAIISTPAQARKIAKWLNEWADSLEEEVQP